MCNVFVCMSVCVDAHKEINSELIIANGDTIFRRTL